MARNLVVCLDGTRNQFSETNTNVVRLYQGLLKDPKCQVTYYSPGVGTLGEPGTLTRLVKKAHMALGLGFGLGATRTILDAYRFLMRYLQSADDRIFIFGFSRGALEARSLAGLIFKCGLLQPELESMIPYADQLYKNPEAPLTTVRSFRKTFSRRPRLHFLGLWDTVTSMGNIWSPITWPHTSTNPAVRHVWHAISLDERRSFFRQNRWRPARRWSRQEIEEVWFPGVHADVGGGYPSTEGRLWACSLEWMKRAAEVRGLLIDPKAWPRIIGEGKGPAEDYLSPPHQSLTGAWKAAEIVPRPTRIGKGGILVPYLESGFVGRPRKLTAGEKVHRSALLCFLHNPCYYSETLRNAGLDKAAASRFLETDAEVWTVP